MDVINDKRITMSFHVIKISQLSFSLYQTLKILNRLLLLVSYAFFTHHKVNQSFNIEDNKIFYTLDYSRNDSTALGKVSLGSHYSYLPVYFFNAISASPHTNQHFFQKNVVKHSFKLYSHLAVLQWNIMTPTPLMIDMRNKNKIGHLY